MVFNKQTISPSNDLGPGRTIKKSRIGAPQADEGLCAKPGLLQAV